MALVIHFLLVYSYSEQKLVEECEYADAIEASAAYRQAEAKYRGRSDECEVVLVGADSRETIMKTHGHYFLAPSDTSAFADLLTK